MSIFICRHPVTMMLVSMREPISVGSWLYAATSVSSSNMCSCSSRLWSLSSCCSLECLCSRVVRLSLIRPATQSVPLTSMAMWPAGLYAHNFPGDKLTRLYKPWVLVTIATAMSWHNILLLYVLLWIATLYCNMFILCRKILLNIHF